MADIRAHDIELEESKEVAASTDESIGAAAAIIQFTSGATKKLLRKLDLRLLPYLWFIYM